MPQSRRRRREAARWVLLGATVAALAAPAWAQSPTSAQPPAPAPARPALTADDYARAERFLSYHTAPLVLHGGVRPTWLPDDRFWYRTVTERGVEMVLVDPSGPTRGTCELDACQTAAALAGRAEPLRMDVPSPDGTQTAFVRDWNLWVRDLATGQETALTTDGVKDFGYATDNAGWSTTDRAIVVWSPDSRKLATYQQDQRQVGDMYLVDTRVGRPVLKTWKYPLPGDAAVTMIERVIVDVAARKVIRLKMAPDQHRSTLCDDLACRGDWRDVQWGPDGKTLAFASVSRDHKDVTLRVADAETGEVRDVLRESSPTFFESGNGQVNWRYLPGSNEVVWFSERDNWGHLYLYDLASGNLERQITTGEGNVTQLLHVDEKTRTLFFVAVGREPGRDPYFRHFYRIGMDGSNLTRLTPADADHTVTMSPSGLYFVDIYSRPDVPPTAELYDTEGRRILALERADISRLLATGWKPPEPIVVKARDGSTDLYGLLYKPTGFDPAKKYPIVNHIYPGPQTGSVGSRSFSSARLDSQALAELGFIVVEIDGMGTPWRSKKFHDAYYGDMGDNTLPDQIAAMRELAARHPWIDLDRAGIWGHSGGGFAAAAAMFRYPDFFKAGVAESGNHDNRNYEDDWAEKWTGLLELQDDGTSNYDSQANQALAKNLKGKLMLAHGGMDTNVPPGSTLLVVDALIRANKDFELVWLPNQGHDYGNLNSYMMRRRWDFFVRHLLGADPPEGYELRPPPDPAPLPAGRERREQDAEQPGGGRQSR
ncbi:MAG: DPP IV N-terminal domain-containing protein [Acidobacteria bacterium]|nr:DPP IV N-terminal domain-containing protein [Acidobacteriota bacterium]